MDWHCTACGGSSYARTDELKPDGRFGPSDNVRCVNCKRVSVLPTPSTPPVADDVSESGEAKPVAWMVEQFLRDGTPVLRLPALTSREDMERYAAQNPDVRLVPLYAALPPARVDAAPRVKPLEWERTSEGITEPVRFWRAQDAFGGQLSINVKSADFDGPCSIGDKSFQTAAAAMNYLNDAYEARILSKQPPSHGPNGNQWARLQHQEQMAEIDAALAQQPDKEGI